jgi:hypothetical protein
MITITSFAEFVNDLDFLGLRGEDASEAQFSDAA